MSTSKLAFVTGGSGDLGQAIVKRLVQDGCRVAFSYHQGVDRADQLRRDLASSQTSVHAYPLDVTDAKACIVTAKTIEEALGPVDILVNNAGMAQVLPFAMIEEADWDQLMNVNLKGMFLVTKAFVRGMIRQKSGSIVNIGSLAGVRMLEVPVHYATAKAAVTGFTLSLARELGRYNIRVNAAVPGMLDGGVASNIPDKQRHQYNDYCALSRPGQCSEIAELVAFLASDKSSYINAQSILADGGI
jgi:3-oxoacyl-[acyl-carrier protein] reductase